MAEVFVDDGNKNIRIKDKETGTIIADQDIIESVRITYGCSDGEGATFGSTYSPHCDISIESNEIIGTSVLEQIRIGLKFVVECEIGSVVTPWMNMGTFQINQPPMFTDDYGIDFSGEGMLGSVFDRTKVDYDYYSVGGIGECTLNDITQGFYRQTGYPIHLPDANHEPDGLSLADWVFPLDSKYTGKKWNDSTPIESKLLSITLRELVAGIALMYGGNAIEYGSELYITTLEEAMLPAEFDYFTEDSFTPDFQSERMFYAPKSMKLTTYKTVPIKVKKSTKGYCVSTECNCNNVYDLDTGGLPVNTNQYNTNINLQWIGKTFETFYFTGSISAESGKYEKATPIKKFVRSMFAYLPSSYDFSGWHDSFMPGNIIVTQITQKNTETQEETQYLKQVYIMEMTFNWDGNISVQLNSFYNGDYDGLTSTITRDAVRVALNHGVVEQDQVEQKEEE